MNWIKKYPFKIIFLIIILFLFYPSIELAIVRWGEPNIIRVPNSTYVWVVGDNSLNEHFFIDNPPSDIIKLKELIENFDKITPLDITAEEIQKRQVTKFVRRFYRESKRTPITWDPASHKSEHPEWHATDLIGSIRWELGQEFSKKYHISERYDDKYGTVIRRSTFYPDGKIEEY